MADQSAHPRMIRVNVPSEVIGLLWLAVVVLARSRAATYAARDRANDLKAAFRKWIDNPTPELTIAPNPSQDGLIGQMVAGADAPDRGVEIVYRAKYTRLDGTPLDGGRAEFAAPSCWALTEDVKAAGMPFPAGVAQWLYHAPAGAQLKATDDGKVLCFFSIARIDGAQTKAAAPAAANPKPASQPAPARQTSLGDAMRAAVTGDHTSEAE